MSCYQARPFNLHLLFAIWTLLLHKAAVLVLYISQGSLARCHLIVQRASFRLLPTWIFSETPQYLGFFLLFLAFPALLPLYSGSMSNLNHLCRLSSCVCFGKPPRQTPIILKLDMQMKVFKLKTWSPGDKTELQTELYVGHTNWPVISVVFSIICAVLYQCACVFQDSLSVSHELDITWRILNDSGKGHQCKSRHQK
jgi:hypothetical protein